MEQGWSKIQNNIHSDPLLNRDSEHLSVWIYLVTHSAYTGYDVMFNGKVTNLKEGQLLTSLNEISKSTGVSVSKINRILKKLKIEKRIETQTDMQKTLITLGFTGDCEKESEKGNEKGVKNDWKRIQETENEKEKRSKREKEKEKEINKNDKNVINNNPLYPPRDEEAHIHSIKDNLFDLFWQSYPKKIGKGYAKKCFDKIKPSKELVDTMIEAINVQKKSEMWQRDKGQYIPNPSTWLNQQRWLDDLNVEIERDNPWKGFDLGITL